MNLATISIKHDNISTIIKKLYECEEKVTVCKENIERFKADDPFGFLPETEVDEILQGAIITRLKKELKKETHELSKLAV